jgi:hypothetical protein
LSRAWLILRSTSEGVGGMRGFAIAIGLGAILGLVGCSSLPIGQSAPVRALDYLGDDLAGALVAFDLPASLEPVPGGSTLTFDLTTPASGARHVRAVLAQSDAAELAGTLPPPADGRSYYLFGFSPSDRQAIREAQAWSRTLPGGAGELKVVLSPALCRIGTVRADAVRVSVRVAVPGIPALAPVIADRPLTAVMGGAEVPPCAGHSG